MNVSFFEELSFRGYVFLYDIYKKISDRKERELIQKFVRPGAVVVDIGANIGHYAQYLSKVVGSNGHVYAFEPSPRNYFRLTQAVSLLKNVSPHQAAVGNFTGKTKLFLSNIVNVDHRLYQTQDQRDSVDVDCFRLDDFFNKNNKIDFIKMDIQGFEYYAFLGMQELLKRNQSIKIIFEFWPHGLKEAGVLPLDLIVLLKQQGFNLYVEGKNKLAPFSEDKIEYGLTKYFNIFASRECLI